MVCDKCPGSSFSKCAYCGYESGPEGKSFFHSTIQGILLMSTYADLYKGYTSTEAMGHVIKRKRDALIRSELKSHVGDVRDDIASVRDSVDSLGEDFYAAFRKKIWRNSD
jgi:hypothetical protein